MVPKIIEPENTVRQSVTILSQNPVFVANNNESIIQGDIDVGDRFELFVNQTTDENTRVFVFAVFKFLKNPCSFSFMFGKTRTISSVRSISVRVRSSLIQSGSKIANHQKYREK